MPLPCQVEYVLASHMSVSGSINGQHGVREFESLLDQFAVCLPEENMKLLQSLQWWQHGGIFRNASDL